MLRMPLTALPTILGNLYLLHILGCRHIDHDSRQHEPPSCSASLLRAPITVAPLDCTFVPAQGNLCVTPIFSGNMPTNHLQ